MLAGNAALSRLIGCRNGARCLRPQVPQYPRDDEACAQEYEHVERLAVEPPGNDRNERNTHEIERHDHARIAGAKSVGETVVRDEACAADCHNGGNLPGAKFQNER